MALEIFRKNLKIIRRSKGFTGIELSHQCGLRQRKRILDIEDGRGKPSLEEIIIICKKLDVSIDDMLNKNAQVEVKFLPF